MTAGREPSSPIHPDEINKQQKERHVREIRQKKNWIENLLQFNQVIYKIQPLY